MSNLMKFIAQASLIAAVAAIAVPVSAETAIKASCPARDVDASLVSKQPFDVSPMIAQYALSGTAVVAVALDPSGRPQSATIAGSAGWPILDDAARRIALAQTYTPEIHNCAAVAGSYALTVQF